MQHYGVLFEKEKNVGRNRRSDATQKIRIGLRDIERLWSTILGNRYKTRMKYKIIVLGNTFTILIDYMQPIDRENVDHFYTFLCSVVYSSFPL